MEVCAHLKDSCVWLLAKGVHIRSAVLFTERLGGREGGREGGNGSDSVADKGRGSWRALCHARTHARCWGSDRASTVLLVLFVRRREREERELCQLSSSCLL